MICHVCRGEAVGQCKDCGKFYCPQHGDEYCVRCRDVTPGKKTLDDLDDFPEKSLTPRRQNLPTGSGPHCYVCQGTAVGACPGCGKFYCSKHGDTDRSFRRGLCESCQGSMRIRTVVLAIFFVVIFAGLILVMSLDRTNRQPVATPQPPPVFVPFNPTFQGKPAVIPAEPSSRPWPPP